MCLVRLEHVFSLKAFTGSLMYYIYFLKLVHNDMISKTVFICLHANLLAYDCGYGQIKCYKYVTSSYIPEKADWWVSG